MAIVTGILLAFGLGFSFFMQGFSLAFTTLWMPFIFLACFVLLMTGKYRLSGFDYLVVLWMCGVLFQAFFLKQTPGSALFLSIILAFPAYYLSLQRRGVLKAHVLFASLPLAAFALCLIYQYIFWKTGDFREGGNFIAAGSHRASWPMVNPNLAAVMMNAGLISCLGMFLHKYKRAVTGAGVLVFGFALWATGSKAGMLSFAISGSLMALVLRPRVVLCFLLSPLLVFTKPFEGIVESFGSRLPIWEATMRLLELHPFTGLGIGTYGWYYAQVRTENETDGFFAHNDFIQYAVELGLPLVALFGLIWLCVALGTRRHNIIPACVLLAVVLQSFVSFPFYMPCTSIVAALALAVWRSNGICLQGSERHQVVL